MVHVGELIVVVGTDIEVGFWLTPGTQDTLHLEAMVVQEIRATSFAIETSAMAELMTVTAVATISVGVKDPLAIGMPSEVV